MSSPRPALVQPAAIGLSAGMILGAVWLAAKAVLVSPSACAAGATAEDCGLEREIAGASSRFFALFSVGLLLVGIGLFVIFRPKKRGPP